MEKLRSDLPFLETKAKGQRPGVPGAEMGERIRQKEGGMLEAVAGPKQRNTPLLVSVVCLLFGFGEWA